MKRMKKAYASSGPGHKPNTTTAAESRKIIVGSTVLSRDKHRHIKYAMSGQQALE